MTMTVCEAAYLNDVCIFKVRMLYSFKLLVWIKCKAWINTHWAGRNLPSTPPLHSASLSLLGEGEMKGPFPLVPSSYEEASPNAFNGRKYSCSRWSMVECQLSLRHSIGAELSICLSPTRGPLPAPGGFVCGCINPPLKGWFLFAAPLVCLRVELCDRGSEFRSRLRLLTLNQLTPTLKLATALLHLSRGWHRRSLLLPS